MFCAGDDKTDEDMFRALSFSEPDGPLTMDPPISVSLVTKDATEELTTKSLALTPHGVFTTAVGHPSKRTLAKWHVTSPAEVVNELLRLAGANKANGTADEAKL